MQMWVHLTHVWKHQNYSLYSVARTCICIFLPEEQMCCTHSITLIHFFICAHSAITVHPQLTYESKMAERKGTIFPFLYHHHFQWNKLRKDKFPWLSMLLWIPVLAFCVWSKFWFNWKSWPLGALSTPAWLVLDGTCLSYTSLESHWTPAHHGSTGILYPRVSHMLYGDGQQGIR